MRHFGTAILMSVGLILLFSSHANSSMGGSSALGSLTTGAADDTGSREWVKLVRSGGMLIGRPNNKTVEMITLDAPGVDSEHLILRELVHPEGGKSFLFTTPDTLKDLTRRVTIYVKHPSNNLVLLESHRETWKRRKPQPIHVDLERSGRSGAEILYAFSVAGLGPYWLKEGDFSGMAAASIRSRDDSPSYLLAGVWIPLYPP